MIPPAQRLQCEKCETEGGSCLKVAKNKLLFGLKGSVTHLLAEKKKHFYK